MKLYILKRQNIYTNGFLMRIDYFVNGEKSNPYDWVELKAFLSVEGMFILRNYEDSFDCCRDYYIYLKEK